VHGVSRPDGASQPDADEHRRQIARRNVDSRRSSPVSRTARYGAGSAAAGAHHHVSFVRFFFYCILKQSLGPPVSRRFSFPTSEKVHLGRGWVQSTYISPPFHFPSCGAPRIRSNVPNSVPTPTHPRPHTRTHTHARERLYKAAGFYKCNSGLPGEAYRTAAWSSVRFLLYS